MVCPVDSPLITAFTIVIRLQPPLRGLFVRDQNFWNAIPVVFPQRCVDQAWASDERHSMYYVSPVKNLDPPPAITRPCLLINSRDRSSPRARLQDQIHALVRTIRHL